jgi:hypothetical protein
MWDASQPTERVTGLRKAPGRRIFRNQPMCVSMLVNACVDCDGLGSLAASPERKIRITPVTGH